MYTYSDFYSLNYTETGFMSHLVLCTALASSCTSLMVRECSICVNDSKFADHIAKIVQVLVDPY